jgi:hypothetical protein
MTQATPKDYWISPEALYIELNAMGDPDYIQASCVSGAQILVYVTGIISYDAGHNYQRWPIQISPTVFSTHSEKYLYVAIPRTTQDGSYAQIVFPSELVDIYGINAEGTQVGSEKYYYIFLQGIISSSGDNGANNRVWSQSLSTGVLASDEAISSITKESEWYDYSTVSGLVTFLKDLTMKAGTTFIQLFAKTIDVVSGGAINLAANSSINFDTNGHINLGTDSSITFKGQGTVTGLADNDTDKRSEDKIVTPAYVDNKALSRVHADTASGHIGFLDGLSSDELSVMKKGVQFGEHFAEGLTGFGGKIDGDGAAQLDSLTLRSFLEVPELRFNRVSIQVGNRWRAPGGGIIDHVVIDCDENGNELYSGTAYLHLEEGEIGKVYEDDICQGIWHDGINPSENETDDFDDSKGNFKFSGFYTAYFRIDKVLSVNGGTNNAFHYSLRNDGKWKLFKHPASMMHFVCYGNFSNVDRQQSRYSTLTYERYLTEVNTWEFSESNIAAQFGDLSNLSVFGLKMDGYSAYLKNIYMSGTIKQFEAIGRKMVIDQSLNGYMAPDETETVTVQIVDGYMQDHTNEYNFKVERDTGDAASDAVWNAKPEHLNCGSVFNISFDDLHINAEHGGISTMFYVTATNGKDNAVTASIEY